MFKLLTFDNFPDFKCIGSDCPYTCCQGWSIGIDEDSYNYYSNLEGSFGDKLRSNIHKIDGNPYFKMDSNLRCPFLNENSLCNIYINIGEDKMCHTCKVYPRAQFLYGDIVFKFLTISCPEAARFILSKQKKLEFNVSDLPDYPVSLPDNIDWNKFNTILNAFIMNSEIIQNRDYPLSERIRIFLLFNNMLTDTDEKQSVFNFFSSPDNYKAALASLSSITPCNIKYILTYINNLVTHTKLFTHNKELFDLSSKLGEYIKSGDYTDFINSLYYVTSNEHEIQFENIFLYNIFVYYTVTAYKNTEYYSAIKIISIYLIYHYTAAIFYCFNKTLSLDDMCTITHIVSKTIEHSKGSYEDDQFFTKFLNDDFNSLGKIIGLLIS